MNGENIGFLEVVTQTANGALPVEGAKVNIFEYSPDVEGAKNSLLYSVLTNQDGKTPKLALDSKNKDLSMVPGNKNPFLVYNITVEKDGYYSSRYINVPVFQGITSVQTVQLIPLLEFANASDDFPNNTRRFNETPNTAL